MDGKNIPMLTWIIPVYNGEKYLAQAINSILRQPCGDFQIIVVDDGSTDKSLEIARSFQDDRIQVVHKENGGVSSARNVGIELANSKYIAFLDADDVICKNAYDETVYNLMACGKYDILDFPWYYAEHSLKYGERRVAVQEGEFPADISKMNPFKHFCSRVYRKDLFEGKYCLRFPEGIRVCEDAVFQVLAMHHAKKLYCVARNWFIYRRNLGSVLHNTKLYERRIQHTIPAWYWCKKQMIDSQQGKDFCDAWLFTEVVSYIELSCEMGVPLKTIQEAIQAPYIQETIRNYDVLWAGRKKIYEEFIHQPKRFWLQRRLRGIPKSMLAWMTKFPAAHKMYDRLRFKENIEGIV